MRNENEFNRHVTARIRMMGHDFKAFKTSDRFHIGASDWIIFHDGRAVALEAKFAKPSKPKGAALGHKISGPQQTYMKVLGLAGVAGWYLIGAGDIRKMYLVPARAVDETGQLYWEDLQQTLWFSFDAVDAMVQYLFGESYAS